MDGAGLHFIHIPGSELMTGYLGYRRYVAHGDDIGGGVVNRLGMRHAEMVLAIQTANWTSPYTGAGTAPLTPAEEAYSAAAAEWDRTEGAYAHVQATRPQTLAYVLNDSPAGLAGSAPSPGPGDLITVPASVLVPHEPKLPAPPESWLRRAYPNLTRLVTLDEGGHFLALESPERFVTEIRDAFRSSRGRA